VSPELLFSLLELLHLLSFSILSILQYEVQRDICSCAKLILHIVLQVAPEVTNRGFYTYACDVWSLGVLLYRMLFAREPWSSFEEAADAETLPLPEAGHMVSQEALDLLRNMLKHDHEARATVKQVRLCIAKLLWVILVSLQLSMRCSHSNPGIGFRIHSQR
jgi:serine/threonine protein kinase